VERPPELEELLARLKAARIRFSSDERKGACAALEAVCEYLRVVDGDIGTRAPIIAVMAALGDLDRGVRPEIVSPARFEGGSQKPSYGALDWGVTTAALTLAREAREPGALKLVAGAAGVDKKALGEMLRNVNRGKAPANTMESYAWFLAKARSYKDMTPKDRAANAIQVVRKMTNIR
jgi:hypothetical protein